MYQNPYQAPYQNVYGNNIENAGGSFCPEYGAFQAQGAASCANCGKKLR